MRRKWLNRSFPLLLMGLLAVLITGCGSKLSDKFDEDELRSAAESIVAMVNAGEIQEICDNEFAPIMQQAIEVEKLEKNLEYVLDGLGEFESFEKVAISGGEDKDTGTPYALVIVIAKYEEGKAQYTISFDTKLKCVGFYIK